MEKDDFRLHKNKILQDTITKETYFDLSKENSNVMQSVTSIVVTNDEELSRHENNIDLLENELKTAGYNKEDLETHPYAKIVEEQRKMINRMKDSITMLKFSKQLFSHLDNRARDIIYQFNTSALSRDFHTIMKETVDMKDRYQDKRMDEYGERLKAIEKFLFRPRFKNIEEDDETKSEDGKRKRSPSPFKRLTPSEIADKKTYYAELVANHIKNFEDEEDKSKPHLVIRGINNICNGINQSGLEEEIKHMFVEYINDLTKDFKDKYMNEDSMPKDA